MYSYIVILFIILGAVIIYLYTHKEDFTIEKDKDMTCNNGVCKISDSSDSDSTIEGGSISDLVNFRNKIKNKNRSIKDIYDSETRLKYNK